MFHYGDINGFVKSRVQENCKHGSVRGSSGIYATEAFYSTNYNISYAIPTQSIKGTTQNKRI